MMTRSKASITEIPGSLTPTNDEGSDTGSGSASPLSVLSRTPSPAVISSDSFASLSSPSGQVPNGGRTLRSSVNQSAKRPSSAIESSGSSSSPSPTPDESDEISPKAKKPRTSKPNGKRKVGKKAKKGSKKNSTSPEIIRRDALAQSFTPAALEQFQHGAFGPLITELPNTPDHIRNYRPKNPELMAFLKDPNQQPIDPLSRKAPRPDYEYFDKKAGKIKKSPLEYSPPSRKCKKSTTTTTTPHPALKRAVENHGGNDRLFRYYEDMVHDLCLPIAGKIMHESIADLDPRPRTTFASVFAYNNLDTFLTDGDLQEDGFHARPSIKLPIPDHIKAILVDDWENVTKNQQLVPLPSDNPVNKILDDYMAFEKPKREPGSAQADILEEVVAGLKEYFDKCLGRILLYRFERTQYLEMLELWQNGKGDWAGKSAGDTYGAEHLCRLLVSLPELIAQTNMDQQSVGRLREELVKMTNWLGKKENTLKYFVSEYETPNQSYIDKARGY